ncbi:MAG: hypothetical protein Q9173_000684 [Seirophora scorigena]
MEGPDGEPDGGQEERTAGKYGNTGSLYDLSPIERVHSPRLPPSLFPGHVLPTPTQPSPPLPRYEQLPRPRLVESRHGFAPAQVCTLDRLDFKHPASSAASAVTRWLSGVAYGLVLSTTQRFIVQPGWPGRH